MPRAGLIALSLTTPATRPWSLTLGPYDVTIGPSGSSPAWGTPIDTITLDEQGPGGVSSLAFSVNDPSGAIFPADGWPVEYRDVTNGVTLFRGWIDHWNSRPAFGGQGRVLDCQATGVDALLDWRYVPPLTIPPGSATSCAIAMLANLYAPELNAPQVANLNGTGAIGFPPASVRNGNAAYPIGFLQHPSSANAVTGVAQSWGGGSLRQAIAQLVALSNYDTGFALLVEVPSVFVAVDANLGLRVWCTGAADQPDDYTTLTVVDTAAGALRAENLRYGGDPGDVLRQYTVTGASAAATVTAGDGSGVTGGRYDGVVDSSVTTEAQARTRAGQALAEQSGKVRGTFELNDWAPSATTIHAGSLVAITDAASGATGTYRIYAIKRTFNDSGRQNWAVEFGGRAPSVANLARRLTRTLT